MSEEQVTIRIDKERCTACGLCVKDCPAETLGIPEDKAEVVSTHCLVCGHCQAICPEGAITVGGLDPDALTFTTFESSDEWLDYGAFDTGALVQFMRSRRSCRSYQDRPVERTILDDLAQIGTTAPSGTNSQKWAFTIMPTRTDVLAFGTLIAMYFKGLTRLAENTLLRNALRLVGKPELHKYYNTKYYPLIKKAIEEWEEDGTERLFHGAPSAIIVSSKPGGSTPAEDALLATQNILLGAHAMGLGTCLIGFAVAAMTRSKDIQIGLSIPVDESIHSVIALGYPDRTYQRCTGRKATTVR